MNANHIRDEFGTCKFCGLPWSDGPCEAHARAKPAMIACEALGVQFVEWNDKEQYCTYRNPVKPAPAGLCERLPMVIIYHMIHYRCKLDDAKAKIRKLRKRLEAQR
jgi:hypothetical protein